jgi:chorismate mutase
MPIRGIRGAITVANNEPTEILTATRQLLEAIQSCNPELQPEDIASIFFTVTKDLNAVYPAKAARDMGWIEVPMLCACEIPVPNGLPKCIRVLIHWNTDIPQRDVQHAYLGEAVSLRPDWAHSHE